MVKDVCFKVIKPSFSVAACVSKNLSVGPVISANRLGGDFLDLLER